MKIIDLYIMLSKGEQPKKFKYRDEWYAYSVNDYDFRTLKQEYRDADVPTYQYLMEIIDASNLNDEVEILEEKELCHKCGKYNAEYNQTYCEFCLGISELEEEKKIPEKLSTWFSLEISQSKGLNIEYANTNFENMYEKINEIIDYLKSKGE